MVTRNAIDIATGASNTVLQGQGIAVAPAFSTATYPSTTTSQQILYSSATNTISEITTANSKLPATNSSGTMAMRAFSVNIQVFTGNGTYTPTTGMLYCDIEVIGGGAGGGGNSTTTGAQFAAGSGGGAGEYAKGSFSSASIGASQSITIGTAGTGSSGAAGTNGGNTSVGALISAFGGIGGALGTAAASGNIFGKLGGTGGSGGVIRTPGGASFSGNWALTGSTLFAGNGGSSVYGAGGIGGIIAAGGNGLGYGAGGGASSIATSGAAQAGGSGTAGVVIVTEYIIN